MGYPIMTLVLDAAVDTLKAVTVGDIVITQTTSTIADGPRDALSVKILSTVRTSCTANPQQLEVVELEGYN